MKWKVPIIILAIIVTLGAAVKFAVDKLFSYILFSSLSSSQINVDSLDKLLSSLDKSQVIPEISDKNENSAADSEGDLKNIQNSEKNSENSNNTENKQTSQNIEEKSDYKNTATSNNSNEIINEAKKDGTHSDAEAASIFDSDKSVTTAKGDSDSGSQQHNKDTNGNFVIEHSNMNKKDNENSNNSTETDGTANKTTETINNYDDYYDNDNSDVAGSDDNENNENNKNNDDNKDRFDLADDKSHVSIVPEQEKIKDNEARDGNENYNAGNDSAVNDNGKDIETDHDSDADSIKVTPDKIKEAEKEVSTSDKLKALGILLSKLKPSDISILTDIAFGGEVTDNDLNRAKQIIKERVTEEEKEILKSLFYKYEYLLYE